MKEEKARGTHDGHLDYEAQARRRVKNARNRSRRGRATHEPGSAKRSFARRGPGRRK